MSILELLGLFIAGLAFSAIVFGVGLMILSAINQLS